MKNKKDLLIGVFVIIVTTGAMIFSLNYTSKVLTQNAQKNTVPIIINKKDPKFKIQNWGMNRTRTKKDAMIERMMKN
jgi:amino acid transporter